jgi:hypothetical protein
MYEEDSRVAAEAEDFLWYNSHLMEQSLLFQRVEGQEVILEQIVLPVYLR